MTSDLQVLDDIDRDLRTAGDRVVYLEGKSDPAMFFGLLGLPRPANDIYQQTLIKGLSDEDGPAGNTAVRRRVDLAARYHLTGVFGIVDGDGAEWSQLSALFDPPHVGPLFAWKAYSIESLFPQVGWPAAWGMPPNWQADLQGYAPYVGLNRLHIRVFRALDTLRLRRFLEPELGPLLQAADVETALRADQHLIAGLDVAAEFVTATSAYLTELATSLERGLAQLNGKWLLKHFLQERLKKLPDASTQDWIAHAVAAGGLPAVRDLWQRITGSPP